MKRPVMILQFVRVIMNYGEVAEWLIASVLKTDVLERVPGVQIPPSPPVKE
jgi:hypothetical protein